MIGNKLSKTEKDKIEGFYRCQRSILEQDIQDELKEELKDGIRLFINERKALQADLEKIEKLIEDYKKDNGFENMDRYGCMRSHPRIDGFRAETNAQLLKLWTGEITTL